MMSHIKISIYMIFSSAINIIYIKFKKFMIIDFYTNNNRIFRCDNNISI